MVKIRINFQKQFAIRRMLNAPYDELFLIDCQQENQTNTALHNFINIIFD